MKLLLIIAASIALIGAMSEDEKGWWIVLFVLSVILRMIYCIAGL